MTYFFVNYVKDQAVIENMYKPHKKAFLIYCI